MSNRHMFHTERYVGIDKERDLLESGIARHPDAIGIVADLASLRLPANSVDVCVSTNTMYQLSVETRMQVTRALADAVAPSGSLLIHYPIEDDLSALLNALRDIFVVVDVTYLRNPFSHAYERLLEHDGELGTQPRSRVLRGVRLLLSRVEQLTSRIRAVNDQAYVRCSGKLGATSAQPFDLSRFAEVGHNLYAAKLD